MVAKGKKKEKGERTSTEIFYWANLREVEREMWIGRATRRCDVDEQTSTAVRARSYKSADIGPVSQAHVHFQDSIQEISKRNC